MEAKTQILVVDDSKFFNHLVSKAVAERIGAEVTVALTFAEAKKAVTRSKKSFNLALVGIDLPDAHRGEAADWLVEREIPCIVFTSVFSEDLRERLLSHNVIDYVIKDTSSSLTYLMELVERLHRNREWKILIVDDSKPSREYICDLLRRYQFQVLEAASGEQGLALLESTPDIRMMIADYYMPEMSGVELVKRARLTHHQDRLAIIGISSGGGSALSAQFLKHGANDFLHKPFLREEFFCRVMQNIRMLDMIDRLTEMAIKDELTGMHNRRYFFAVGEKLVASVKRRHITLTTAIIDLDFFKNVNDTYGHESGDMVLKQVAGLIQKLSRESDIAARIGGEEFAILAVNMAPDSVSGYFNKLRRAIEAEEILHRGKHIPITASIGIYRCSGGGADLTNMLSRADQMLYQAKGNGRNRVEIA